MEICPYIIIVLLFPTWSADNSAGFGAGMFAIFEHLCAVYENMDHAGCILVRFFISCMVSNCFRVENDDVRIISFFKLSPPVKLEITCRQ